MSIFASPLRTTIPVICALTLTGSRVVWAVPPDTAWLEDVHLQPSGPPELQLAYGFQGSRDDAAADINTVALSSKIGFDRAPLDFVPRIGLLQPDATGVRMDFAELRVRFRLAGTPGEPIAIVYGGYRRVLRGGWDHLLEQGLSGRWLLGNFALAGELSVREGFGERDPFVELRPGLAATYGLALDLIRFGIESFALVPLTGERFSDFGLGNNPEGVAVYVGPSLRLNLEYLWVSVSTVTGRITRYGASVRARAVVTAQF